MSGLHLDDLKMDMDADDGFVNDEVGNDGHPEGTGGSTIDNEKIFITQVRTLYYFVRLS